MYTLFSNCTLLVDAHSPLLADHYLLTENELIVACGPMATIPQVHDAHHIDGRGGLLMPGLVNGHNHCAMTLFRGLADDLELSAWLHDHIFPAEAAHANPEMVFHATRLAAAEMLLSGTTCVADAYFFSGRAAQALSDCGMRAVVGHGIVDFPAPSVPDPAKNIEAVADFIEHWLGRNPLITPAVFAHAPYTCSPTTLTRAKELARHHKVRFFTHIAESRGEQSMIIDPQGDTPLTHLARLGLLDEETTLVHGVWLSPQDIANLAASGAGLVTCPQSNLKLGSGTAPLQELLAARVPIGLGTDGCASNNGLDMFREMGMLARLHKLSTLDATAMPAQQVLAAATSMGAHVLGLPDIGSLAPGHKADIILLDTDIPRLTPFYSGDLLVYAGAGSDVRTVMIHGTLVVNDRQILTFDLAESLARVRELADRITPALRQN